MSSLVYYIAFLNQVIHSTGTVEGEMLAGLIYLGPRPLDKRDFVELSLPGSISWAFKIKSKRGFLE